MMRMLWGTVRAIPVVILLAGGCGKGGGIETPPETPAPSAPASTAPPLSAARATEPSVESAPRGPVAVALPSSELELGGEPDDAPHVDRALRMMAPREGDRVIGRGFVIDGVPEDFTVYWPEGGDAANTYVIYDAGLDHVATITETPRAGGGARFDPGDVAWRPLEVFAIWRSEFADSQTKQGAGETARFEGPAHAYRIDRLVPLPWLTAGFAYRVDPAPGS